jgi:hypothetical protein
MSASYKRIKELLDRWQASIDLHTRYLALDDEAYAKVQAWPKHPRPTKWVLEIARTRLAEMRRELELREEARDPTFAESLELMSLLANLLGAEHIERFIPLASGKTHTAASGTVRRPRIKPAEERAPAPRVVTTRAPASPSPRVAAKTTAKAAQPAPPPVPGKIVATVVADAVRFLGWGREWPALAPSIARLADRPSEAIVSRILRENRAVIESKARHAAG